MNNKTDFKLSKLNKAKIELADWILKDLGTINYSNKDEIDYFIPSGKTECNPYFTDLVNRIKHLEGV